MVQAPIMGSIASIPGVVSYSKGTLEDHWKKTMNPTQQGTTTSQGAAQPQQSGGLMGQFNDLLKQRQGLQNEKMSLQEQQLKRTNTQKNNTAFKTTFTNRDNMVDLMRQLLDASRRGTAAQQRVFM